MSFTSAITAMQTTSAWRYRPSRKVKALYQ